MRAIQWGRDMREICTYIYIYIRSLPAFFSVLCDIWMLKNLSIIVLNEYSHSVTRISKCDIEKLTIIILHLFFSILLDNLSSKKMDEYLIFYIIVYLVHMCSLSFLLMMRSFLKILKIYHLNHVSFDFASISI